MSHIFTIAYNEALMLPHFIAHYRTMFPNCAITVYDNMSTDATVDIALSENCEVIQYDTGGKLSDTKYLEIKNHCWKQAKTDWVLVCDVDELCLITQSHLETESKLGATVIDFRGWNMVNHANNLEVLDIYKGVRSASYDKRYCFNKKYIAEINYGAGAHNSAPFGTVRDSKHAYICKHYKYINADYMVQRHSQFANRLSDENKAKGYGAHYLYTEAQIRKEFEDARKLSTEIKY